MKIRDIIQSKKFVFSIEVFPPKPETEISVIYDTIDKLKELKPDFLSITYGAGGSTRGRTVEIAETVQKRFGITTLAHLTCIGATKDSISKILDELGAKGVKNILALRGDLPAGAENPLKDFKYAVDLVSFIKKRGDFCIGAACYPEKHPEAPDADADIIYLKNKVDAGVDFITSQLFLENNHYFAFIERVRAAGIEIPVIPGIMTATKLVNIERMATMCGVEIPERFRAATSTCDVNNPVCEDTVKYTVGQINHLIKNGVKAVHLYTMNKAEQNIRIYNESMLRGMR